MLIDHLLKSFTQSPNTFMIWKEGSYSYQQLETLIAEAEKMLASNGVSSGDVILLQADFSPKAVAMLLALIKLNCIVGLISPKNENAKAKYAALSQANQVITVLPYDAIYFDKLSVQPTHELLLSLRMRNEAGLIIFSSGSSGSPKATVHSFNRLFDKFKQPKKQTKLIAFLLFDHIGGLNLLFYTLFSQGCLIALNARSTTEVLQAIDKHKAEALTTTPTFLNMLLLSDIEKYDLTSLKYINYSTEVMPSATLERLNEKFPDVRISQAYGSSEIGVLPVSSKSSDSLFIKLDKDKLHYRIVNSLLELKISTSMLGYLNADSPFTEDGWYKTGDSVEVQGEYLKILGRNSEIINIGGEKVYPAEIENVLQNFPDVEDVTVFGEKNLILGEIITAKIKINSEETKANLKARVNLFCEKNLPHYKIPQKIIITNQDLHNERFKKTRNQEVNVS